MTPPPGRIDLKNSAAGRVRRTQLAGPAVRRPPGGRRTEKPVTENGNGQPAERLAYSVCEAATMTGLSRDLLYDQMRAGKLAYLKVGRRRIITRQHLEAFLTQEVS